MTFLIDIFGFLSVVTHGLTIFAQSAALGGALFIVFLVRPLSTTLAEIGPDIGRRTRLITMVCAAVLVACELATVFLQAALLVGTVDLTWPRALSAEFAIAGFVKCAGALVILCALAWRGDKAPAAILIAAVVVVLAAATLTTHGNARIDGRAVLMSVEMLHQFGAAIWIGGLPCFMMALARCHDGLRWRIIGKRFSQMSTVGVAAIVLSGAAMVALYVGSLKGLYGTAFGVMVSAKMVMFAVLLGLGGMNYLLIERLRRDPSTPVTRLKRFAEIEAAIGFAIFFAAASVTSSPPAVDLTQDRVTWQEIIDRNTPEWPRFRSPSHADLALSILQGKLDADAAAQDKAAPPAFVPGGGEPAPRNAQDIAWSEYNHHWAGIFVVAMGLLALLAQAGVRGARHWPLVFFGLATFLFLRSDPEVWPLGAEGFWISFRDVEVVQHRMFVVLTIAFGLFEWRVRAGAWAHTRAALVFPVLCAAGGILLLTHQHAISNVKDQLLIELTHTPLALAALAAGCLRWLELRLAPPIGRWAGWGWPLCFVFIGLLLVFYREA